MQSKTPERLKSDLYKIVERIEERIKVIPEMKKQMEKMEEILKGKVINGNFVEEEVVIDVNYMNDGAAKMMLIDCGAPKSVVSKKWIEEYLREMRVKEEDIERSCCRRFRMGETTYISEVEITFPIVLKTDEGDYMRRMVKAYIIEAERVNFLLGKESIVELNVILDCPDYKIVFKDKG